MSEYIERDAFSEEIIRKKAETVEYWTEDVLSYRGATEYARIENAVDNFLRGYNEAVENCLAFLDNVPAADVAPVVHARWIYNNSENFWQCSRCSENAPTLGKLMQLKTNYCPNCGCKMDGE